MCHVDSFPSSQFPCYLPFMNVPWNTWPVTVIVTFEYCRKIDYTNQLRKFRYPSRARQNTQLKSLEMEIKSKDWRSRCRKEQNRLRDMYVMCAVGNDFCTYQKKNDALRHAIVCNWVIWWWVSTVLLEGVEIQVLEVLVLERIDRGKDHGRIVPSI